MRIKTITLTLLLLALFPAASQASSKQLAIFQADENLVGASDSSRNAALSEISSLGADVIKIQLIWADVAPKSTRKPAGFDASDPADYPGWARYDAAVSAAQAAGFRVLLALAPAVPGYATKPKGDLSGANHPSAAEFGRFAEAAGKHYSSVDMWTLWNEPNHPGYLYPQATKSHIPYSPRLYRGLIRSGVAGLKRAGHGGQRILFGELLPIGKSNLYKKNTMRPIRFLRELFCLDSHWRAYRGRAARQRGCNGYRKIKGVNGFAYHPYTRPAGPRAKEPSADDATIRSYGRITRALDIARRKGRIGGGKLSIWNTEFDFQSDPPDSLFGAKLSKIPDFMSRSEWIAYRNPRVASHSQYQLYDTPIVDPSDRGLWQGGLRFADGREKPGVYAAYRLPLFVRLLGPSHVEVWGAARPGGRGASVQIQSRLGKGAYTNLRALTVRNVRGYFKVRVKVSRAAKRKFRVSSGGHVSWPTKAVIR